MSGRSEIQSEIVEGLVDTMGCDWSMRSLDGARGKDGVGRKVSQPETQSSPRILSSVVVELRLNMQESYFPRARLAFQSRYECRQAVTSAVNSIKVRLCPQWQSRC